MSGARDGGRCADRTKSSCRKVYILALLTELTTTTQHYIKTQRFGQLGESNAMTHALEFI